MGVGLAFLASIVLGVLSARWILAYSGSRCLARAGGAVVGGGLVVGPALHNLACYLAMSNRRLGVSWNFFSEQGRRRPWLNFLNATSAMTHFCACLILFLSLLYLAREAFSARRRRCLAGAACAGRLIVAACAFCWVSILEGMEPRPCRTLMNQWLHVGLNHILSIVTLHWAHASLVRQFGHASSGGLEQDYDQLLTPSERDKENKKCE